MYGEDPEQTKGEAENTTASPGGEAVVSDPLKTRASSADPG
jgi:hypothetical protein